MKVNHKRISVERQLLLDAAVVDVRFDGHRVWSAHVPEGTNEDIQLRWPEALRTRLRGRTQLTLTDSATQKTLAQALVKFGRSPERLELTDARGRWLAMTKWDRLGPVLEGRDIAEALLANARRLVDDMRTGGFDPYMVGGTLLGMVRDGGLLPHDDDVDLAYLSEHSDPSDIGLESYRLERLLLSRDYTVVRHSLAHLEVEFFDAEGRPDHYVDIFTGFMRDGLYSQPFALRGPEIVREDLLPTRPRTVGDVELPEPASPEAWLAYAYGPGWRVPDPTFKFISPRSTISRFESWFGVFNRGRVYWDKRYLSEERASGFAESRVAVDEFANAVPVDARILDIGCGDGLWTKELAAHGHRVTGVDYSHEALRIARSGVEGRTDFRYLNLNDRASVLEFGAWMLRTKQPWYVFALHSMQSMTKINRQNVFLLLSMVLRGNAFAQLVSDANLPRSYRRNVPSTWHLPTEYIVNEIEGFPLQATVTGVGSRQGQGQRRTVETVRIDRVQGSVEAGDREYVRRKREKQEEMRRWSAAD